MFLSATFFPLLFSLLFFLFFFFLQFVLSPPPRQFLFPSLPLIWILFAGLGTKAAPRKQRSPWLWGPAEGGGRMSRVGSSPGAVTSDRPGGADAAAGQAQSRAGAVATATLGLGTGKGA